MTKTELIAKVAKEAEVNQEIAKKCVNAFTDAIIETLKAGDDVQLVGFGTFKVSNRAARQGKNPRTGEVVEIKASKVPAFKAGKAFKDALN